MTYTQFSWIKFYTKFADRLLEYKYKRSELIKKLLNVFTSRDIKLPKLDFDGIAKDIDPFSIFALFNRHMTEENRKSIIAGLASEFNVSESQPSDFNGVPIANNITTLCYAFSNNERRGDKDIDNIWAVFESGIAFADNDTIENRSKFISAYNTAYNQIYLANKLTMGLFWIRPFAFISLDSNNRILLDNSDILPEKMSWIQSNNHYPDADTYLNLRDKLLTAMKSGSYEFTTFPELSLHAWQASSNYDQMKSADITHNNALGDADVESVRYWLYAPGEGAVMWDEFYRRGIMALGCKEIGNLSSYFSKDDIRSKLQAAHDSEKSHRNLTHALWNFAYDIKPGDIVFVKRGRTEILGRGVVKSDYKYDLTNGDYPHIRDVVWSHKGCWRNDEMFALKTLTEVTDYTEFVSKIEGFFESDESTNEQKEMVIKYPEYSKNQFLSDVYMNDDVYDTLVSVLRSKKNIILQGAPGVGKTFVAKRLAYSVMGKKDISRVMMIQFHQSYSYEDFIEGYRPCTTGFELTKGAFYTFCKKAAEDEDNDYFFIIDEINRGNLSKIFGELFMLIENDKRGSKNKLQLLYSHELFYVPSNVYIIGMMNTADRSLAMLDYALRRRFAFFDLKPAFSSDGFRKYRMGLDNCKVDALVQVVEQINEDISKDDSLGEGFCIGHSYFCNMDADDCDDAKLSSIINYELVPLLKEYWFDEPEKVHEWTIRMKDALR